MSDAVNVETVRKVKQLLIHFDGDILKVTKALSSGFVSGAVDTSSLSQNLDPQNRRIIASIDDVVKTYKSGRKKIDVIKNISLDIYEGEMLAIMGPSGSGKSTLLNMLGAVDKVSSGNITVDGVLLSSMDDAGLSSFRNKTIGFVFQSFYLQPFLRVAKNIEVAAMFARTKPSERRKKVAELLDIVGLTDQASQFPSQLSGGQVQRAAVARAMLNSPKILIADEPTGNLDSVSSGKVMDLFRYAQKRYNMTVVIVTHDQQVANLADRKIVIQDGKLL